MHIFLSAKLRLYAGAFLASNKATLSVRFVRNHIANYKLGVQKKADYLFKYEAMKEMTQEEKKEPKREVPPAETRELPAFETGELPVRETGELSAFETREAPPLNTSRRKNSTTNANSAKTKANPGVVLVSINQKDEVFQVYRLQT